MKSLSISVTKENFFNKYLLLLNGVFNLRPLSLNVFAEILYLNNLNIDINKEDRALIVFSAKNRAEIAKKLVISRASLDNQITYLRKREFLLGIRVNPIYEILYETHKDLMISFNLKEE
jgi:hypothetical protein